VEARSPPHPRALELTWLGHATAFLELDGARLLTDPLLRGRVAHLARRAPAPRLPAPPDAVLVSHAHRDHLDPGSLRLVPREAVVVVPRGLGAAVRRLGFADVVEVVVGDELELAGLRVRAVRADHAPGRNLPRGAEAVGYAIAGTRTVYFAGDTDVYPELAELAGAIDLALLPVGGWGPRVPAGHLDPERAAQAAALVRPAVAVPIHWGTFRPFYRRHPYPDDLTAATRFAARVAELAPDVEVRILLPGERFTRSG
jgi:L-ascorbate metabolism protein UlaG (beta-lactamase superfamily)